MFRVGTQGCRLGGVVSTTNPGFVEHATRVNEDKKHDVGD